MEAIMQNAPLAGGLGAVIGLILGALIMRLINGGGASKAELQAKLDEVEAEFEAHKQSVNSHFETTSDLVQDLTESYVKVYKHLSLGATQLSGVADVSNRLTLDQDGASAPVIEASSAAASSGVTDEAIEETLTELEATAKELADNPNATIEMDIEQDSSIEPQPEDTQPDTAAEAELTQDNSAPIPSVELPDTSSASSASSESSKKAAG